MEKNKVTSYLLYAIGEIVLVVVGILIAVSIDDWNDNRINKARINTSIGFMLEELKRDSLDRQGAIDYTTPMNVKINDWYNRINSKNASLDTVVKIMRGEFIGNWATHFRENTTAYDNMKSTGILELIPDTIRIQIDEYYKSMNRSIEILEMYNIQYREPLEEYNKTYSILRDSSFIANVIWSDIDTKHFLPRARWLVFTKMLLWSQYEKFCRRDQDLLIELQKTLLNYKKVNI